MRRVLALLAALLLVSPVGGAAASVGPSSATNAGHPASGGGAAVAQPGPVGYWKFDEGSGAVATDASGHGLDGSITGAAWVSRRTGGALAFASWTDRVVVPRNILLEPAAVTVDAWVRANGSPGQWAQIVAKGESACSAASYTLYTGTGGGLEFFISDGTTAIESPAASPSVWDNVWHHVAGTFDGAFVRLYVDGAQVGTGTPSNGEQIGYAMSLTNDLAVGSSLTKCAGGNRPWVGQVDDVRVWGKALTLSEIRALEPPTTTALASSSNPVTAGSATTLRASVSPSAATGTVTFTDTTGGGSDVLGTASLTDGAASISATFSSVGARQLVATYGGDADYDPSTSPSMTQVVASSTIAPTTTTLAVTPNPVPAGSTVTFTATVNPAPTLGDVQWLVDGIQVGTTAVGAGGTASTTQTYADPGAHAVQARFVEGTLYADSQSGSVGLTVSPVGYAVTLTATWPIIVTGTSTTFFATVSPGAAGTFKFYKQGAPDQLLASQTVAAGGFATFQAVRPAGTTVYRAEFIPTGASAVAASGTATVQGKDGTTIGLAVDRTAVTSGEGLVTFTATVGAYDATGTVTFRDVTSGQPLKVLGTATIKTDANYDQVATFSVRLYGAFVHKIDAVYNGDVRYVDEYAYPVSITVSPDTGVSATGVGVSAAAFYPYKDGYLDTVGIRGTLLEPASVAIRVYSPARRLVRSFAVSSRAGAYTVAWNGRTASGALLPAARYRVVQTVRDVLGHTRSFTSYATLSNKRIHWYTGSQTKYGASYSAYDVTAYAIVSPAYSVFYRGVELFGNAYSDEWAAVKYVFTLPSANVYKSLKWSALGKARNGGGPASLELWNFKNKSFDANRHTGLSYGWYTLSASATSRVSSRHVWAWVTAYGANSANWDVAKVKLTYTYGVLR